jgi:uncharacterized iron-regulated protein
MYSVLLEKWMRPDSDRANYANIIARTVKHSVILLGETHANADHHRWQLQMHAMRSDMVIGFEMFPRRVQAVFGIGSLDEKALLVASE